MSHPSSTPGGHTSPNNSGPVSKSNTTSATLTHSDGPGTSTNTNTHPADEPEPTYNLGRFLEQDMFDDGALHGRVPDDGFCPRPSACKPFYRAKAANAIDALEMAFAAGQQ